MNCPKEWRSVLDGIEISLKDNQDNLINDFNKVKDVINMLSDFNNGCTFEEFIEQYIVERDKNSEIYNEVKEEVESYIPQLKTITCFKDLEDDIEIKRVINKSPYIKELQEEFGNKCALDLAKTGCYNSIKSVYLSLPSYNKEIRNTIIKAGIKRVKGILIEECQKAFYESRHINGFLFLFHQGTELEPDWQEICNYIVDGSDNSNLIEKYKWFYLNITSILADAVREEDNKKIRNFYEVLRSFEIEPEGSYIIQDVEPEVYNKLRKRIRTLYQNSNHTIKNIKIKEFEDTIKKYSEDLDKEKAKNLELEKNYEKVSKVLENYSSILGKNLLTEDFIKNFKVLKEKFSLLYEDINNISKVSNISPEFLVFCLYNSTKEGNFSNVEVKVEGGFLSEEKVSKEDKVVVEEIKKEEPEVKKDIIEEKKEEISNQETLQEIPKKAKKKKRKRNRKKNSKGNLTVSIKDILESSKEFSNDDSEVKDSEEEVLQGNLVKEEETDVVKISKERTDELLEEFITECEELEKKEDTDTDIQNETSLNEEIPDIIIEEKDISSDKKEKEVVSEDLKLLIGEVENFIRDNVIFKDTTEVDNLLKGIIEKYQEEDISRIDKLFIEEHFKDCFTLLKTNTVDDLKFNWDLLRLYDKHRLDNLRHLIFGKEKALQNIKNERDFIIDVSVNEKKPYTMQKSCDKFIATFIGSGDKTLINFYAFLSLLTGKLFQWGQDEDAYKIITQLRQLKKEDIEFLKKLYKLFFSTPKCTETLKRICDKEFMILDDLTEVILKDYYNLEYKRVTPIILSELMSIYDVSYNRLIKILTDASRKFRYLICQERFKNNI